MPTRLWLGAFLLGVIQEMHLPHLLEQQFANCKSQEGQFEWLHCEQRVEGWSRRPFWRNPGRIVLLIRVNSKRMRNPKNIFY